MSNLKRHTIRVNGIRMHVAEAGEGPPVVLLHRFPETWYAWRKQRPDLARDYHVIMPDLRGYRDTDKPDTGYDKRNMAEDIRQAVRHSVMTALVSLATTAVPGSRPDWRKISER